MAANRAPLQRENWEYRSLHQSRKRGGSWRVKCWQMGCHGAMWLGVVEPIPSCRHGQGSAVRS